MAAVPFVEADLQQQQVIRAFAASARANLDAVEASAAGGPRNLVVLRTQVRRRGVPPFDPTGRVVPLVATVVEAIPYAAASAVAKTPEIPASVKVQMHPGITPDDVMPPAAGVVIEFKDNVLLNVLTIIEDGAQVKQESKDAPDNMQDLVGILGAQNQQQTQQQQQMLAAMQQQQQQSMQQQQQMFGVFAQEQHNFARMVAENARRGGGASTAASPQRVASTAPSQTEIQRMTIGPMNMYGGAQQHFDPTATAIVLNPVQWHLVLCVDLVTGRSNIEAMKRAWRRIFAVVLAGKGSNMHTAEALVEVLEHNAKTVTAVWNYSQGNVKMTDAPDFNAASMTCLIRLKTMMLAAENANPLYIRTWAELARDGGAPSWLTEVNTETAARAKAIIGLNAKASSSSPPGKGGDAASGF